MILLSASKNFSTIGCPSSSNSNSGILNPYSISIFCTRQTFKSVSCSEASSEYWKPFTDLSFIICTGYKINGEKYSL